MTRSRFAMLAATLLLTATTAHADKAYLAGGCFWCVESDFEGVPGVSEVISGYTGGDSPNPTYGDHEGHFEAVEIDYDPARVSYERLVELFFRSIDPTDDGGQFCDRGSSYRTAIFVETPAQRATAERVKAEAQAALGQTIVTPILDAGPFWTAEDYHQDYYKSAELILTRFGPLRKESAYKRYREGCGRDARIRDLWGPGAPFLHD